jgi:hypothetical protein
MPVGAESMSKTGGFASDDHGPLLRLSFLVHDRYRQAEGLENRGPRRFADLRPRC